MQEAKTKLGAAKESLEKVDLSKLDWNTIEAFKTVLEPEEEVADHIKWVESKIDANLIRREDVEEALTFLLTKISAIADIYTQNVSNKLEEAKDKKKAMHESMQDSTKSIEIRLQNSRPIAEEALKAFQLVQEAVELLGDISKDELKKMNAEAEDLKEKVRNEYNSEVERHEGAKVGTI